MNLELHNFSRDLEALTDQDMFAISQDFNTIEPSTGDIARNLSFLEQLTFLDYVSAAFVITLLVFSLMPTIKRTKFWRSMKKSTSSR